MNRTLSVITITVAVAAAIALSACRNGPASPPTTSAHSPKMGAGPSDAIQHNPITTATPNNLTNIVKGIVNSDGRLVIGSAGGHGAELVLSDDTGDTSTELDAGTGNRLILNGDLAVSGVVHGDLSGGFNYPAPTNAAVVSSEKGLVLGKTAGGLLTSNVTLTTDFIHAKDSGGREAISVDPNSHMIQITNPSWSAQNLVLTPSNSPVSFNITMDSLSSAFDAGAPSDRDNVVEMGWNVGPGGAVAVSGQPAHGRGSESHWYNTWEEYAWNKGVDGSYVRREMETGDRTNAWKTTKRFAYQSMQFFSTYTNDGSGFVGNIMDVMPTNVTVYQPLIALNPITAPTLAIGGAGVLEGVRQTIVGQGTNVALSLQNNSGTGKTQIIFKDANGYPSYIGINGENVSDPEVPFALNLDPFYQGPIVLKSGGVEKARMTPAGNWGMGTTNPGVRLDVAGDIRASGTISGSNVLAQSAAIAGTVSNRIHLVVSSGLSLTSSVPVTNLDGTVDTTNTLSYSGSGGLSNNPTLTGNVTVTGDLVAHGLIGVLDNSGGGVIASNANDSLTFYNLAGTWDGQTSIGSGGMISPGYLANLYGFSDDAAHDNPGTNRFDLPTIITNKDSLFGGKLTSYSITVSNAANANFATLASTASALPSNPSLTGNVTVSGDLVAHGLIGILDGSGGGVIASNSNDSVTFYNLAGTWDGQTMIASGGVTSPGYLANLYGFSDNAAHDDPGTNRFDLPTVMTNKANVIAIGNVVINTNGAPATNTIVGFFWLTNGANVYKVPLLQ